MTDFKKRLVTGIATAAIVAQGLTPVAFAGTTIEISGNGSGSDNWANVSQNTTTVVNQSNNANVSNNVDANANTGNNDANFNTGGDVHVNTGDASVNTTVSNVLNSNAADVNCCANGDTNANISGNGAYSNNGVRLNTNSTTNVNQSNDADVENDVEANAKTGYNDAHSNTGGDVVISTGKASVDASVSTMANVNSARVSSHSSGNPEASFWITGNGAGSDNYITAYLSKETGLNQDNDADIENDIEADAKSGGNEANFNTGGDVMIDTGDAEINAEVDNSVNFNYADVDCGCTWDVLAKIAGNGAENHYGDKPDNIITLGLNSSQAIGQGNDADLENDLEDLNAKTGYNESNKNTGEAESDPAINTGDAEVHTGVSNTGNVNTVGDNWEMPEWPEVEFSFNFAVMMAFFGMSL